MSIWQNKVFKRLFAAYALSTLGDYFDSIAMSILLVYRWHTGAMSLSLILLAYAVPGILFGQLGGVLADRWNKVRLMFGSDLLRGGLTVAMFFTPSLTGLLCLIALRSVVGVFNAPAQAALTRHVVADEHLLKASTYNGLVLQLSKVLGPLAGASLASAFSPQWCLLINALTFIGSAFILLTVRRVSDLEKGEVEQAESVRTTRNWIVSWQEGWQILYRNRPLLCGLILSLTAGFTFLLVDFQGAIKFREVAPDDPKLVGLYLSFVGAGSVAIIVFLNRLKDINRYGLMLGSGYLLLAVGFGNMGLIGPGFSLPLLLATGFIGGIGNGLISIGFSYLLQKETPKAAIGRVMGILNSLSSLATIISPLCGGALIERFGPSLIFQGVGVGLLLVGVLALLAQKWVFARQSTRPASLSAPPRKALKP